MDENIEIFDLKKTNSVDSIKHLYKPLILSLERIQICHWVDFEFRECLIFNYKFLMVLKDNSLNNYYGYSSDLLTDKSFNELIDNCLEGIGEIKTILKYSSKVIK